jgi:hypothetical protein
MQITDAEQPLVRPPARSEVPRAAAWYDPDSVTFMDSADGHAEAAADEPAVRKTEADRTPVLEPA